jgi:hypothetical protein
MYLGAADLIDMTVKQLEMLEEILRADARALQQPKGQLPLPGCANEDEL